MKKYSCSSWKFLCCCFWQVHQCGALFRRRHVYPLLYVYFHSHSLLCWNDIKLLPFFVSQACSLGQCWLPPLSSAIPTGPEPYSEQFPEPWGFWHLTMRVMTPSLLHTACTPRNMSSLKRCVFSALRVHQGICHICTTFHTISTFVWGPLCCWTPCVKNLQWNISLLQDQLGTSHCCLSGPTWDLFTEDVHD